MKKFLILLLLFVSCSVYIFYLGVQREKEQALEGDPPIERDGYKMVTLGGSIEEPKNDQIKIGEIQTSYIMYRNGDITFDDMVEENIDNLQDVLIYPWAPEKGYLFSSDYSELSRTQVYYQSNQEETRTVVIKVVYNEEGNKVTKIYDGEYFKLVVVDVDNPERVIAYDINGEEKYIDVE